MSMMGYGRTNERCVNSFSKLLFSLENSRIVYGTRMQKQLFFCGGRVRNPILNNTGTE
jgi:hypothetical protein